MANSTLAAMQEIETAAKAVLAEYDQKIQAMREQLARDLDDLTAERDQAIEAEVVQETEKSAQRLAALKAQAQVTIEKNDASVRSALTDKKEDLVQQIVDKVVEKYGN